MSTRNLEELLRCSPHRTFLPVNVPVWVKTICDWPKTLVSWFRDVRTSSALLSQVSLRKQEIADRLNAWIIFHEKNKELCDWLTQMENKVVLSSDLNIEEMVEKLKKVKTSPLNRHREALVAGLTGTFC